MPVFLSVIGGKTYALLRDLLAPAKPQEKTLAKLAATSKQHFEPKLLLIAEWFHFYRWSQGPSESRQIMWPSYANSPHTANSAISLMMHCGTAW